MKSKEKTVYLIQCNKCCVVSLWDNPDNYAGCSCKEVRRPTPQKFAEDFITQTIKVSNVFITEENL